MMAALVADGVDTIRQACCLSVLRTTAPSTLHRCSGPAWSLVQQLGGTGRGAGSIRRWAPHEGALVLGSEARWTLCTAHMRQTGAQVKPVPRWHACSWWVATPGSVLRQAFISCTAQCCTAC